MRVFLLIVGGLPLLTSGCACPGSGRSDASTPDGVACFDAGPMDLSIHDSSGSSSVVSFAVEPLAGSVAWAMLATDGGLGRSATISLADGCASGVRLSREVLTQRAQRFHVLTSTPPSLIVSATPDGVETRVDLYSGDSGTRLAVCTSVGAPAEVARLGLNSILYLPGLCSDECGSSRIFLFAGDSLLGRHCLEGRDEFGWVPGGSLAVYSTALVPLTPGAPRWTVFVTEFDRQGAVRSKAEGVSAVVVRGFVSSRSFLSWPARDPRGPFVPIGIQVGMLLGDGGIEFTDDAEVSQVVPIPEEFVDGAGTPVVRGLLLDGGEALAVVADGGVVRSAFGPLARDWGLARHRAALSNGLLCRIGRTALDGGGIGYSLVCE